MGVSKEVWICTTPCFRELKNVYHHQPESKKRKSLEGNSGSIQPYGGYGNARKTSKTISTIAILWPVKAIFEKRATTVEVDTFTSPVLLLSNKGKSPTRCSEHNIAPDVRAQRYFAGIPLAVPAFDWEPFKTYFST